MVWYNQKVTCNYFIDTSYILLVDSRQKWHHKADCLLSVRLVE